MIKPALLQTERASGWQDSLPAAETLGYRQ